MSKLKYVKFIEKRNGKDYCEYKCDCGNLKIIRKQNVDSEKTKSCGKCRVPLDLTGKRFGKLKVIKIQKKHNNAIFWECECDCGNKTNVVTYSLTKEMTKSCGCLKNIYGENHILWKGYKKISGHFFSGIKSGAKSRNIDFNITIEDAWKQFLKQNEKCALSGLEISFGKSYRKSIDEDLITASLDRIDNTKGYEVGNIQWAHKHINIMKRDHPQEYFLNICEAISNFQRKKH